MSKKIDYENSQEKQSLKLSSLDNEENVPFLSSSLSVGLSGSHENPKNRNRSMSVTPLQDSSNPSSNDKKKIDKTLSGPTSSSRIPSFKLSSPNNQGYTKVTYVQEKKADGRKSDRQPGSAPPQKRESTSLFSRSSKSNVKQSPLFGRNKEEKKFSSKLNQSLPNSIQHKNDSVCADNAIQGNNAKKTQLTPTRVMERPTQHHTFPSDAADVRQIEKELLQLMEDFETGNLRAFGKHSRLRQMEEIREQQERLARLHFDVGAEQDLYPPLSEDGLRISQENTKTLMEKLAQLSESIESLHSNSHLDRKTSSSERKTSTASFTIPEVVADPGANQTNTFVFQTSKAAQPPSVPPNGKSKENRHPSGPTKPPPPMNTFPKATSKHADESVGQQNSSHTIPKRNPPPASHKKVAPPIPPPPNTQQVAKKLSDS